MTTSGGITTEKVKSGKLKLLSKSEA